MLNSAPNRPKMKLPLTPPSPVFIKSDSPVSSGNAIKLENRVVSGFSDEEISNLFSSMSTSDEETLFERINFYLFNNQALPPYGQNIILPDLESIKDFDFRKLQMIVIAALGVLALAGADEVYAKSPNAQQNIKKAQVILESVDPIELLLLRNSQNSTQDKTFTPDEEDKLWMSRNIGAEAETLGETGKLGVMISVLERVKNPKFPKTIKEVILQAYQYSWANSLEKNPILPNVSSVNPGLVEESIFNGMKIDENLSLLRTRLLNQLNSLGLNYSELPIGATDYHVLGMYDIPQYKSIVKSETTKKKILLLRYITTAIEPLNERLQSIKESTFYIPHLKETEIVEGKRIFKGIKMGGMGHIHYTSELSKKETIDGLFKLLPDSVKTQLQEWK